MLHDGFDEASYAIKDVLKWKTNSYWINHSQCSCNIEGSGLFSVALVGVLSKCTSGN